MVLINEEKWFILPHMGNFVIEIQGAGCKGEERQGKKRKAHRVMKTTPP